MIRIIAILFLTVVVLNSCEKIEGQGGSSDLIGKVYFQDKDLDGDLIGDKYPAQDVRVYIIYGGEGTLHDDDYRSSYDGSYRFEYLTNGTYKIFAYQECPSCDKVDEPVIKTVTIDSKHSSVTVPDIILDNY